MLKNQAKSEINSHGGTQNLAPIQAPGFLDTGPNRIYLWYLRQKTKNYSASQSENYYKVLYLPGKACMIIKFNGP